jgi:hypothetical protein
MKALAPVFYATMATAAANWAMWHATKELERERMSQRSDGRAFATRAAKSKVNQEAGETSGSHPLTAIVPVRVAPWVR